MEVKNKKLVGFKLMTFILGCIKIYPIAKKLLGEAIRRNTN